MKSIIIKKHKTKKFPKLMHIGYLAKKVIVLMNEDYYGMVVYSEDPVFPVGYYDLWARNYNIVDCDYPVILSN